MRFSAAILSGGKAQRYGGIAKGMLTLTGGETIIDRSQKQIKAAGIVDCVLSANEPETYQFTGLPIIADQVQDKGPLAGLCAVLEHFHNHTDAVLFVPCDLPMITNIEFSALTGKMQLQRDGIVFAATCNNQWHSLCTVIHVAMFERLHEALLAGSLGVTKLWHELHATPVYFENAAAFVNLNSAEDEPAITRIVDFQNGGR